MIMNRSPCLFLLDRWTNWSARLSGAIDAIEKSIDVLNSCRLRQLYLVKWNIAIPGIPKSQHQVALSSNPRSTYFWGSGKDFPPAWELRVVFTTHLLAPNALEPVRASTVSPHVNMARGCGRRRCIHVLDGSTVVVRKSTISSDSEWNEPDVSVTMDNFTVPFAFIAWLHWTTTIFWDCPEVDIVGFKIASTWEVLPGVIFFVHSLAPDLRGPIRVCGS
jgi:hypothetical protein